MIEPILLTTTQISTFATGRELSQATGFFFWRGECVWHQGKDAAGGIDVAVLELNSHKEAP